MQESGTVPLSAEIDKLIQANEMLMKENDLLVSFIERHQNLLQSQDADGLDETRFGIPDSDSLVENDTDTLSVQEKVLVAICEAEELKNDTDVMRSKGAEITLTLKAFTLAAESKLSELRRWLFMFRKDVLGDPQAALSVGDQVTVTVDENDIIIQTRSPSPSPSPSPGASKTSRSPSPGSRSPTKMSRRGSPDPGERGTGTSRSPSPARSPSPGKRKGVTSRVGARVFDLPPSIQASKVSTFYNDVLAQLGSGSNAFRSRIQLQGKELHKLQTQLTKQTSASEQASSVDFDQLAITNAKYVERIAAKNQELLRLKLTSGNTILVLNSFKADLNKLLEEKKVIEKEIYTKRLAIDKLNVQIAECRRLLGGDKVVLKKLRQNEIASGDGPASIDFISLIATQDSLKKAVSEYTRKIAILETSLKNLQRDVSQGQALIKRTAGK